MIHAREGGPVIVPLDLIGSLEPRRSHRVVIGGKSMTVPVWVVTPGPVEERASWLAGLPDAWMVEQATSSNVGPNQRGVRVMSIDWPAGATDTTLAIDGEVIDIAWLEETPVPAGSSIQGGTDVLAPCVERLARQPWQRWRARWMAARAGLPATEYVFSAPLLEAWARQMEVQWNVAIDELRAVNEAKAREVVDHLAGLARVSGSASGDEVIPVFPINAAADERLLATLLDAEVPGPELVEAADAWLEEAPEGISWVVDDAGAADARSGVGIASVGAVNLRSSPSTVWIETGEESPESWPVGPGSSLVVRAAAATAGASTTVVPQASSANPRATRGTPGVQRWRVRVGEWARMHEVVPVTVPVKPPGATISGLRPDWTMQDWLASTPAAPVKDAASTTAILLHRRVDGQGRARWWVYGECLRPAAAPASSAAPMAEETIRLWYGPFRSPVVVMQVPETGSPSLEVGNAGIGDPLALVRVTRGTDRWIFDAPIPDDCIADDGTLRFGVERLDASGVRTAWPRAMLPWQIEPGRIAFGTQAWTQPPEGMISSALEHLTPEAPPASTDSPLEPAEGP